MITVSFNYATPENLDDTVALLRERGTRLLAGGQSLLNEMKLRHVAPTTLVDLRKIQALHTIQHHTDGSSRIGSMVTFTEIMEDRHYQEYQLALIEAVKSTPGTAIRNRSTIGGNLAQNSPGADLPAIVLAANATINIFNTHGALAISADDFCSGKFTLASDEIITSIDFPAHTPYTTSAYEKFKHHATGNAICGVAATLRLAPDKTVASCRIAVTGVTNHALRLFSVEEALKGKALCVESIVTAQWTELEQELITDLASSAAYRAYMTRILAGRAITRLRRLTTG